LHNIDIKSNLVLLEREKIWDWIDTKQKYKIKLRLRQ